jgi:hypothetical protein
MIKYTEYGLVIPSSTTLYCTAEGVIEARGYNSIEEYVNSKSMINYRLKKGPVDTELIMLPVSVVNALKANEFLNTCS